MDGKSISTQGKYLSDQHLNPRNSRRMQYVVNSANVKNTFSCMYMCVYVYVFALYTYVCVSILCIMNVFVEKYRASRCYIDILACNSNAFCQRWYLHHC